MGPGVVGEPCISATRKRVERAERPEYNVSSTETMIKSRVEDIFQTEKSSSWAPPLRSPGGLPEICPLPASLLPFHEVLSDDNGHPRGLHAHAQAISLRRGVSSTGFCCMAERSDLRMSCLLMRHVYLRACCILIKLAWGSGHCPTRRPPGALKPSRVEVGAPRLGSCSLRSRALACVLPVYEAAALLRTVCVLL